MNLLYPETQNCVFRYKNIGVIINIVTYYDALYTFSYF